VGNQTDFLVNVPLSSAPRGTPAHVGFIQKHAERLTLANATGPRVASQLLLAPVVAHRGAGSGSGTTGLVAAMSLCESVDAYGFGTFRGRAPGDYRYLHWYDPTPIGNSARGGGRLACKTAVNDPRAHAVHEGGHQVLESNVRDAVWHAFGMINLIC
jgi:hypothetical protein